MRWFRVAFDDAISHTAPSTLFEALVTDMIDRGHPIKDFEAAYGREHAKELGGNPAEVTEWAFDCGGSWIQSEPIETLVLDGLTIEVACSHFDIVAGSVKESRVRQFSNGTQYHKLKFWRHATVLTVDQLAVLRVELQDRSSRAERRIREFMTAWNHKLVSK